VRSLNRFLSENGRNSREDKDKEKRLLLSNGGNNPYKDKSDALEFLSENERNLVARVLSELVKADFVKPIVNAYKLILEYGVVTFKDLSDLASESTVYRWLSQLKKAGLIVPVAQAKLRRLDGAPPMLYGVPGFTEKQVQRAVSRYIKMRTTVWAYVEQVYQATLPDVTDEGIQYRKILWAANRYGSGLDRVTIAEEVARMHRRKGVRVWQ